MSSPLHHFVFPLNLFCRCLTQFQARTTLEALAFERDLAPKYAKARRLARLLGHVDDKKSMTPFSQACNCLLAVATRAAAHSGSSSSSSSSSSRTSTGEVPGLTFLRQSPPSAYHQGSAWANAAQQLGGTPWKCLLPLWPLDLLLRCYNWASDICQASRSSSSHSIRDRRSQPWWMCMKRRLGFRPPKGRSHKSPNALSHDKLSGIV